MEPSNSRALVPATAKAPRKKKATAKAKPDSQQRPKFTMRKREYQDSRLYNLKLDINDVKQEIAQLLNHRSLLESQVFNRHDDFDGTCQKTVVEYFKVFARGFAESPYDAVSYIRHMMAPDIRVNNFTGREMVLEQWKMHSVVFHNFQFRFVSATVLPISETTAMVRSTARFQESISRQSLAIMFPHILHREDIIAKLVGKTMANFGRYDFLIDAKTMEILSIDVVLDYFSCFAQLLPDPLELAVLFGQALIKDEFYIGEVDDPPPRPPRVVEVNEAEDEVTEPPTPPASSSSRDKMRLDHILSGSDSHETEDRHDRAGQAY